MKRRKKPIEKVKIKKVRLPFKVPLVVARAMCKVTQKYFEEDGIPQYYISKFETGEKDHLQPEMKKLIEYKLRMVGKIDWNA
jgi:hypothetical protein